MADASLTDAGLNRFAKRMLGRSTLTYITLATAMLTPTATRLSVSDSYRFAAGQPVDHVQKPQSRRGVNEVQAIGNLAQKERQPIGNQSQRQANPHK